MVQHRDVSTRWQPMHIAPLRPQPAPTSLALSPGAARCSAYAVYDEKVVLEYCLWRGCVPVGETYALGSQVEIDK